VEIKKPSNVLVSSIINTLNPTKINYHPDYFFVSLHFYQKNLAWPIDFGNSKMDRRYLQSDLVINPRGIDPNYFYGEFLYDKRHYTEAKKYLELAMQAAPRQGRPLADKSRQQEVTRILDKVNKKINH
jgi:hypothetical protein